MLYTGRTYNDEVGYSRNFHVPPGIHIMNKNESTALRKLKKETGLSEEELRKHKQYRKILSEAQKQKGTKTARDRRIILIVKQATRELKLAVDHPTVKKKIGELIDKSSLRSFGWVINKPSVNHAIQTYKSLKKK